MEPVNERATAALEAAAHLERELTNMLKRARRTQVHSSFCVLLSLFCMQWNVYFHQWLLLPLNAVSVYFILPDLLWWGDHIGRLEWDLQWARDSKAIIRAAARDAAVSNKGDL
jgi:hypothetical protein